MFAYRSSEAIGFANSVNKDTKVVYEYAKGDTSSSKQSSFSADGKLYAWITLEGVNIMNVEREEIIQKISLQKVLEFVFSPKGAYMATFERMQKRADGEEQHMNVCIWSIKTGDRISSFPHKNPETWKIQWTEDEAYFARLVTNNVHFYDKRNPKQIASKLSLEGVEVFSISPGKNPSVAVFVPEKKGNPAIVRLYGFQSFNYPLSNKTFYKAEEVEFHWNPIGTNVLVLTRTLTDKTGKSYYGETNLYYLSAVGNYDCRVSMDKPGPIHDITWNSRGNEFVVVYGNIPAKGAIFDQRANKIFDFGESPKNYCRFSPQGRLILLAGFGNLAGKVEIWDRKNLIKLSEFQEESAVLCEFSGMNILSATLSPRMRVDNRFRLRNYTGEILWEMGFKELYTLNIPKGVLVVVDSGVDEDQIELKQVAVADEKNGSSKKASSYIPPHLRKKVAVVEEKSEEKKINAIMRKLKQINQLKERLSNGEELEKNQLEKLQQEESLLNDLKKLKLK